MDSLASNESPESNPVNVYQLEEAAQGYELLRHIPEETFKEYGGKIINHVPEGGTVLDAGYGPGHILLELAREGKAKNIHVVGIDNSSEMHRLLEEKIHARNESFQNLELVEEDIINYLFKHPNSLDCIHFKAILHCFRDPKSVLDAIDQALKSGGIVVTGHEISQTEAGIEQLPTEINDPELADMLDYYFKLRANLAEATGNSEKKFTQRVFPAGDSANARDYFLKKGYEEITSSEAGDLNFERTYTLLELLNSIQHGTFGVFRDGLSEEDRVNLTDSLKKFAEEKNMDLMKVRKIPARLQQFAVRKP